MSDYAVNAKIHFRDFVKNAKAGDWVQFRGLGPDTDVIHKGKLGCIVKLVDDGLMTQTVRVEIEPHLSEQPEIWEGWIGRLVPVNAMEVIAEAAR